MIFITPVVLGCQGDERTGVSICEDMPRLPQYFLKLACFCVRRLDVCGAYKMIVVGFYSFVASALRSALYLNINHIGFYSWNQFEGPSFS